MKSFFLRRRLFVVTVIAAIVLAMGAPGFADLRIVTESDGELSQTLVKNARIKVSLAEDEWMLIDCAAQEITLVGDGVYWRGSQAEFSQALAGMGAGLMGELGADPEAMALFSMLFSSNGDVPSVRITKGQTDKVAGFSATQYVVETGSGGEWATFEQVWLSAELMGLLQAEAGQCISVVNEAQQGIMEMVPFLPADVKAVVNDAAYQKLHMEAYPVRTVTTVEFFGMSFETVEEVVEVSREPLAEGWFVVPAGYEQLDNPLELFGGNDV